MGSHKTDVRSHNPPRFRDQRPCWHTVSCPLPFHTIVKNVLVVLLPNRCGISQSTPLQCPSSLLSHRPVSTPLLHPYKECLVLIPKQMWDLTTTPFGSQRPCLHIASCLPPFGASILLGTTSCPPPSGLNLLVGKSPHVIIHPLLGPSVFTCTPPRVHSLRGPTSLLAHRLISDSNTVCNAPSPPLTNIVLFGFFRSGFPSSF